MTAVMQSSTAAVAVTLSAHFAGATVRRTIARSLGTMCESVGAALNSSQAISIGLASDALDEARAFISEATGPPESEEDQERLTNTLYALDDTSRLADVASEKAEFGSAPGDSEDARAADLCAEAMRNAVVIATEIGTTRKVEKQGESVEQAMIQLERCAKSLRQLQPEHRKLTLGSVASGATSADGAMARVDTVRRLELIARHAWLAATHLVDPAA